MKSSSHHIITNPSLIHIQNISVVVFSATYNMTWHCSSPLVTCPHDCLTSDWIPFNPMSSHQSINIQLPFILPMQSTMTCTTSQNQLFAIIELTPHPFISNWLFTITEPQTCCCLPTSHHKIPNKTKQNQTNPNKTRHFRHPNPYFPTTLFTTDPCCVAILSLSIYMTV